MLQRLDDLSTRQGQLGTQLTRDLTSSVLVFQSLGSTLPALSINYFDSLSFDPLAASKPCIYIMPSMSHSALVCRSPAHRASHSGPAGWWEEVVGFGDHFGINLDRFRVLSASPLGAPYGTTSPLSIDPRNGRQYRAQFPLITPLDQARVHAYLLDHLGIRRVHAIVGASMGGMQVLQFAVHFPQRYDRIIAIATTAQTSPSTQALRGVQRAAVRTDPFFADGNYADAPAGSAGSVGPVAGMGVARMVGTICYRSREEFDARFDHRPIRHVDAVIDDASTSPPPPPAATSPPHLFEVEQYLRHQAATFTGRYDANCYLTLSACMDLMDIGGTHVTHPSQAELASGAPSAVAWSYEHACSAVPAEKQILLLPIASDALIPPAELERLARSERNTDNSHSRGDETSRTDRQSMHSHSITHSLFLSLSAPPAALSPPLPLPPPVSSAVRASWFTWSRSALSTVTTHS